MLIEPSSKDAKHMLSFPGKELPSLVATSFFFLRLLAVNALLLIP